MSWNYIKMLQNFISGFQVINIIVVKVILLSNVKNLNAQLLYIKKFYRKAKPAQVCYYSNPAVWSVRVKVFLAYQ